MVARRDAGRAERVPRQPVPGTGSQAVGPGLHIRRELRTEGGAAGQGSAERRGLGLGRRPPVGGSGS